MRLTTLTLAVVIGASCLLRLEAGDWMRFRGPNGSGVAEGETGVPVEWGPEKNIKWKVALPEAGNGSPIVVGDRVFVTCAEDQGRQRHLLCFDREDGSEIWRKTVAYPEVEETHETNPYCATTPASDGDYVVVFEGSAGIHCYTITGSPLWSRDLGEFRHIWGYASSPIIYDGKVIQLCGPGERTFLTALDLESGDTLWETPEPGGSASDEGKYIGTWSTPVIVNVDGKDQILCGMHGRAAAYDPDSGEVIWYVEGVSSERGDLMYTSPMVGDGVAVIMGGFRGPAFGMKLGGEGDMTAENRLWYDTEENPQRIGSGVVIDGNVFMANADGGGSLECTDIRTGKTHWWERRTGDGAYWGSVVFADGRLYVNGQDGVTRVFAPNPDRYESIAANDLGEQCHSTPAISDGEIFLRTFGHLYCVSTRE
ncbi:MAG: serine/threonine protein kinase [Planctomycetota bacterium]|nr:MAG: serine/threonine protein kinase [Planctomycetota bacterium]REJ91951.1 MAG: serine/threonine protein kinase [Planctomycetota bacterium]REK27262.1 MAG: serine/threonine protein kinase [Planctomycetota bacterium]REK36717.1 MAG: serine/threonine protein kinase [Planctomycetota bacterium]